MTASEKLTSLKSELEALYVAYRNERMVVAGSHLITQIRAKASEMYAFQDAHPELCK